jgi:O-antigen/teichoic acid export membrane protein
LTAPEPRSTGWTLVSGSSVYLFSNLLTAVLAFAMLPIFTRWLAPAEYGEVAMFQTLVGALGAVVGCNAVSAMGRKYYDGIPEHELRGFVAAGLQIMLATTALAMAAVLAFADELSSLLNLRTFWSPWAVLVCLMGQLMQLRLVQWQVRQQAIPYAAFQASEGVVGMLLALLLVVGLELGATGRIAAAIATATLFAMLALVLLRRCALLRFFTWQPAAARETLAYGVPLLPHVAAGFMLAGADRMVVSAELGLAEAGIYMVAAQVAIVVGMVFDAVNKSYAPWLFEHLKAGAPQLRRKIVRYTYAWFALLLAGALLAFVAGPHAIRWIAGARYAAAGDLVAWLVLGQVFVGMYLMVTNYLFYAKRTGLLSVVTVASAVLSVVLLVLLTHDFGAKGAAMAFCVAMGVRFLLTWWAAQRSHPMPWFAWVKVRVDPAAGR